MSSSVASDSSSAAVTSSPVSAMYSLCAVESAFSMSPMDGSVDLTHLLTMRASTSHMNASSYALVRAFLSFVASDRMNLLPPLERRSGMLSNIVRTLSS